MPEPTLEQRLDQLQDAIDQIQEAQEAAEGVGDISDQLADLTDRIEIAKQSPDAGTYADLAVDLMTVIPDNLPLPDAAKQAIKVVASGLAAFIQGATGMALTLLARRFRQLLQTGMSPSEAAETASGTRAEQAWLLSEYRAGRVTAAGDTRETQGPLDWLGDKLKGAWNSMFGGFYSTDSTLPPLMGCLVMLVIVVGVVLLLLGGEDGVAGPVDEQPSVATATAAATQTATEALPTPTDASPVETPTAVPEAPLTSLGEVFAAMLGAELSDEPLILTRATELDRAVREEIDRTLTDVTTHSAPEDQVPPQAPTRPETEFTGLAGFPLNMSDMARQRIFLNTVFPCGEGDYAFTLCPEPLDTYPGGEHVAVVGLFAGDVPVSDPDPEAVYQYGFVFDADGDPSNNYRASTSFPNDFFDNTDLWYIVSHQPGAGWSLNVSRVRDGSVQPMESAARVVILDEVMLLVAPANEFAVERPPYRVTAFWHTGDFGINPPHTWSGDVEPAVGVGLSDGYLSETLILEE